jgi:hypothetical protein
MQCVMHYTPGVYSGHLHFGLSQLLSTEGAEGGEFVGGGGEPLSLRLEQQQQPRLAGVLPQRTCQADGRGKVGCKYEEVRGSPDERAGGPRPAGVGQSGAGALEAAGRTSEVARHPPLPLGLQLRRARSRCNLGVG